MRQPSGLPAGAPGKPIAPGKVWETVERRYSAAGLPSAISNHSFRATGITLHEGNGGSWKMPRTLPDMPSARTTRRYVRKERRVM